MRTLRYTRKGLQISFEDSELVNIFPLNLWCVVFRLVITCFRIVCSLVNLIRGPSPFPNYLTRSDSTAALLPLQGSSAMGLGESLFLLAGGVGAGGSPTAAPAAGGLSASCRSRISISTNTWTRKFISL